MPVKQLRQKFYLLKILKKKTHKKNPTKSINTAWSVPLSYWNKYDVLGPFQVKYYRIKSCCCFLTPGNVERGSQSYANEILMAAFGHDLHAVHRMSTNLLAWYLLCTQRENQNLGNMVLNSFHFYTRWNRWMGELGFFASLQQYFSHSETMGGWTWKVLCNEASFRFGKNLASSGIQTSNPVIRRRECLPLGHTVASKME